MQEGHASPEDDATPTPTVVGPALTLLPFQRRWVEDDRSLKIVVKARQIGYSFAATLRAVLECVKKKTTWVFLSKGERQSRLLMEKVQEHIQSCGIVAQAFEPTFFEGTMVKQLETRFANGSVIYGLPANPDTARGYTGNVTLDEFAFHQDAAKVYSALYPTITRGFSLEVISTPNGQQGKFFEIAKAAGLTESGIRDSAFGVRAASPDSRRPHPASSWSGHKVSIYDAVAQGLDIDIEALRAGCDDEETWLQEYCCAFLSDAQNYIPLELIISCESSDATTDREDWPSRVGSVAPGSTPGEPLYDGRSAAHRAALQKASGDFYLGVDIGRKRDLTVAWLFEKLGDVLWSRALVAMKGQTFEVQEKAICDLIETGGSAGVPGSFPARAGAGSSAGRRDGGATVRRCCVDQSGLGMMLAERLQKKYGPIVEPVQFTAQVKEKLAPMVKQHFEERLVRIPDNREIRADINAVKRFVTATGNVRFDAEHTDKGHADRFWALALALNAASTPMASFTEYGALVGQPIAVGMRERVL